MVGPYTCQVVSSRSLNSQNGSFESLLLDRVCSAIQACTRLGLLADLAVHEGAEVGRSAKKTRVTLLGSSSPFAAAPFPILPLPPRPHCRSRPPTADTICSGERKCIFKGKPRNRPCFWQLKKAVRRAGTRAAPINEYSEAGGGVHPPLQIVF